MSISRIKTFLTVTVMIFMTALASCTGNECLENRNSLPLAGFYASTDNPSAIVIDSISIYGLDVPGDSILMDSARSVSEAYLPFRIDEPSTSYVIQYLQKNLSRYNLRDTITFVYDIIPFFVSSGCGAIYKYRVTDIHHTSALIDSVTCPYGTIDNENIQNLRIYFRVSTEKEGEE